MSITPKKYHGPEVKCGGYGICSDCTQKLHESLVRNIEDLNLPPQTKEKIPYLTTLKLDCCQCYRKDPMGICPCDCHKRY
jgi:ferredoxin